MKPKPDFLVTNHGSVWSIQALSRAAKLFAEEHLKVEPWMGTPDNFITDWRPAYALCEQLKADGYVLRGVT